MTNEDAIKVLKMIEAHGSLAIQAKEKAIQALEAQPKDAVSREEINEFINIQLTDNEEWMSSATYEGRWVEEKKYFYGVEILEGLSEYVNDLPSVTPKYTDEEIDKAQAVEQAYVDKMVELAVEETKRPKGKWIRVVDKAGHWVWECEDCKWQQRIATNFCPDCGAEMSGGGEE